ncbi:MAG TPA: DUF559 domain-containing protein [Sphingomicrobium sp.]|nr:DUF559 domain-containing protein [Sphingomicrobium sp.]
MKANRRSIQLARAQRRSMSLPEVLLWQLLRRSPCGVRFRRQYAIGPFVADFYCPAAKLVIEIDGQAHAAGNRGVRNEARDAWLRANGLAIMRIPAAEVLADVGAAADALVRLCAKDGPSTIESSFDGPPPRR